jgi:hypothetical protein
LDVYAVRSPNSSFATYRTYVHGPAEGTPVGFRRTPLTTAVWGMVQRDLDRELAAKGYTLAAAGAEPDLLVRTTSGQRVLQLDESAEAQARPEWMGPDVMARYTQATLVIDVMDAHTRKPVWHGSSRRVLDPVPTVSEASVANAVRAILQAFPPEGDSDGPPRRP